MNFNYFNYRFGYKDFSGKWHYYGCDTFNEALGLLYRFECKGVQFSLKKMKYIG